MLASVNWVMLASVNWLLSFVLEDIKFLAVSFEHVKHGCIFYEGESL